jgi:hypothetical protein
MGRHVYGVRQPNIPRSHRTGPKCIGCSEWNNDAWKWLGCKAAIAIDVTVTIVGVGSMSDKCGIARVGQIRANSCHCRKRIAGKRFHIKGHIRSSR